MKPAGNMKKLIKKLRFEATADTHKRILGNVLEALEISQQEKSASGRPNIKETIMKNPISKLAAAAVIIIGIVIGLHMLGPDNIVLADVLEQIEQIKAYTYKMKMNLVNVPGMSTNQGLNLEMEVVIAKDRGMLTTSRVGDRLAGETYVVLDEKAIVSIMPNQKQYMRIKLTDKIFEKMLKENGDPRALVKQFTENKYTELGRSIVDGIEAEGFESNDPNIVEKVLGNVVGRIWIDTATKLPVRCEIEVKSNSGETMMDMTVYDFEWNIEVAPDFFVLTIADDYKLVAEMDLSADEKYHLEILGLFAELTGGKYPSELTVVKVMEEFQNAMIENFGHPMTEAEQPETIQKIMSLQMTGAFFTHLASENRDPAYYGATVTAEFPHAVLMRWKTDAGMYKVIFGDLSVREVTGEELEQLEAAPLNLKATAIKPEPFDGAEGTVLNGLKLIWMTGAYATAHRVYFGTDPDEPALLGEVTTEYAEPGTLQRGITYYWRVDEVQVDGSVITGELWSFNTGRLVAHWKLDEGAGDTITNSAGAEYNGKIIGDPAWTTGIIGGALEFNSEGDYIEIEDSNDLTLRNQITVCAWIKTDKIVRRWQAIATKGDRSWRLQGSRNGNALEFSCSGLLVPDNRWGSLYGITDVNDGRWHHVAGVYDGERISLYLDGQVDNSKPAPGKIRLDDKPVFIGNNSQHPNRYWNGLIDDVRIYSYGLTADEVSALSRQ